MVIISILKTENVCMKEQTLISDKSTLWAHSEDGLLLQYHTGCPPDNGFTLQNTLSSANQASNLVSYVKVNVNLASSNEM